MLTYLLIKVQNQKKSHDLLKISDSPMRLGERDGEIKNRGGSLYNDGLVKAVTFAYLIY